MPTRFSGSAAASVTVSPEAGCRAHSPQRFDRDGQRELLAEESADKSPAANFAAIFQTAQSDQQFAPARNNRFARDNFAKNHAVAP